EQILLIVRREVPVVLNHLVCLRVRILAVSAATVRGNRLHEVRSSSVMEEEGALSQPPERRRPGFVPGCCALADVVGEPGSHVMKQEIRKKVHRNVAQSRDRRLPGCDRGGVAKGTTDRLKDLRSVPCGGVRRTRPWLVEEAHEGGKLHAIAGEPWSGIIKVRRILRSAIENAARCFVTFVGKQLVGYAHLHVVGFAGKYLQGLVLCLPAKPGDGAIVSAGVGTSAGAKSIRTTADSEIALAVGVRTHLREDGRLRNRLDQAAAKYWSRNAEDEVSTVRGSLKVRLRKVATLGVAAPGNREQGMHSTVRGPQVRPIGKTRLTHRPVAGDKERDAIARTLVGGSGDLWVCERTRATGRGLCVALTTTFCIKSWSESVPGVRHRTGNRLYLQRVIKTRNKGGPLAVSETGDRLAGTRSPATDPRVAGSRLGLSQSG